MFEIESKDRWTEEEWDAEDTRVKALQNSRARDVAVSKSVRRHVQKEAKRKKREENGKGNKVPFGAGMGWDVKDRVAQLSKSNDGYSPTHDGRIWLLPG